MGTVRGLTLWLAPAILASIVCTLVWHWSLGGGTSGPELGMAAALGVTSLIFTLGGSALLTLAFAWSGGRSIHILVRYGLIVAIGGGVGGAMMLPLGTAGSIGTGVSYGLATGLFWIALHRAIYRGL